MRLRQPCEHNRYEAHDRLPTADEVFGIVKDDWLAPVLHCPGGEFLPEDALIIEDRDGFVRALGLSLFEAAGDPLVPGPQFFADLRTALAALAVSQVGEAELKQIEDDAEMKWPEALL